jgi:hypothetical protein
MKGGRTKFGTAVESGERRTTCLHCGIPLDSYQRVTCSLECTWRASHLAGLNGEMPVEQKRLRRQKRSLEKDLPSYDVAYDGNGPVPDRVRAVFVNRALAGVRGVRR